MLASNDKLFLPILKKLFAALIAIILHLEFAPNVWAQASSQISYDIPTICFVGSDLESIILPSGRKGATASDDFTLVCNAANGADISMQTRNGGLAHRRFRKLILGYTAILSSGRVEPLDSAPLRLVAEGGRNPNPGAVSTSSLSPLQVTLAKPTSENAKLTVVLDDRARLGGIYNDTIEIAIRAN